MTYIQCRQDNQKENVAFGIYICLILFLFLSVVAEVLLEAVFLSVDPYMR